MPILLRRGGAWVVVENVHAYPTKPTGAPKRVIAAYLYQTNLAVPPPVGTTKTTAVRHKLFDLTIPAPTGVVGTSPPSTDPNHHTRATLSWNAVPKAVGYKITRWTPAPTITATGITQRGPVTTLVVQPSPVTATSYVFSGMTPSTSYAFQVVAINEIGVASAPSKTVILNTGAAAVIAQSLNYPSNPPADRYVGLDASSSDTWTPRLHWGNAYQVTQGYLSSTADRGYGCINYYHGYENVSADLDNMYPKYGAGIGNAILDHLGVAAPNNATIVDATFARVVQLAGCSAGNNVYMYPATFSYNSGATAPKAVGSSAYFDAPGPGVTKNNFRTIDGGGDNSHLLLWATNLCKKVQVHNGLMIYRSDTTNTSGDGYAGYCKLRSKSDPNDTVYDWRINLWIKFSFTFKPYIAPVWS